MRPENAVLPIMLNDKFIGELFELWILKEFLILETTDKLGLDTCFVGFLNAESIQKMKSSQSTLSCEILMVLIKHSLKGACCGRCTRCVAEACNVSRISLSAFHNYYAIFVSIVKRLYYYSD